MTPSTPSQPLVAAQLGTTPDVRGQQSGPAFVVTSEVTIGGIGAERLEAAFADRLREVDNYPGFHRLEVWRDTSRAGIYLMVTWWDSPESFTAYLRSPQHRRSHDRIPTDPARPRGTGLHRFERISC
jgi:heme-degrading monooxygenase HmoA